MPVLSPSALVGPVQVGFNRNNYFFCTIFLNGGASLKIGLARAARAAEPEIAAKMWS